MQSINGWTVADERSSCEWHGCCPRNQYDRIGDECAAKVLLADSSRQLLIPNAAEWRGMHYLDSRGEL